MSEAGAAASVLELSFQMGETLLENGAEISGYRRLWSV